jgi:hypothetical protein
MSVDSQEGAGSARVKSDGCLEARVKVKVAPQILGPWLARQFLTRIRLP